MARADVTVAPATVSRRLERLRLGRLGSFVESRRGVSEIVFITDVGSDEPGPRFAKHRCGSALVAWLTHELAPVVARDFSAAEVACTPAVCSGPNTRTEEWGVQTALYFEQGRLYAVVETSQYISPSESASIDAFVEQELKRAATATCH